MIVVGGNDVTTGAGRRIRRSTWRMRSVGFATSGAVVVVGTCPDLGALREVPQPLRALGSRMSRQLAAAQAETAVRSPVRTRWRWPRVVGPFFITNPDEMFSLDRFHPSALGYKRTAKALVPSVLVALGALDEAPFGHHPPADPS